MTYLASSVPLSGSSLHTVQPAQGETAHKHGLAAGVQRCGRECALGMVGFIVGLFVGLNVTAQFDPAKPAPHTQAYPRLPSTHVPAFVHGYDAQASRFTSQCTPAQPESHTHEYCVTHAACLHGPSAHVAPFMHGDDEHSAIGKQVLPPSFVS